MMLGLILGSVPAAGLILSILYQRTPLIEVTELVSAPLSGPALQMLPADDLHDDPGWAPLVLTGGIDVPEDVPVDVQAIDDDAEDPAADLYRLRCEESALSDAIGWVWTQLEEAGATRRGAARRAVSMTDDAGADSEDRVRAAWAELRAAGAQRRIIRHQIKELRARARETATEAAPAAA